MNKFENIKKEYQKVQKEINELIHQTKAAISDNIDYSKLLLSQTRMGELNIELDYQSDQARRVREQGGLASDYQPLVQHIKENRLHIAGSLNDIATYIELELIKLENVYVPKIERFYEQPQLEFPVFESDLLSYLKFKNEFLFVMEFVDVSDEIKAMQLKESLRGEVLSYVGRFPTYDEMWKRLDRIYDNKWKLANESLNDFFSMQKPKDETDEIEHYWDTAINKLRNILSLEMDTEKILLLYIIMCLPMPFRGDFVSRLPYENLTTKMISIDEANKTFHEVVVHVPSVNTDNKNNDSCKQDLDDQNNSDEGKGYFPFPEFPGKMATYQAFKGRFMSIGSIYGMSNELKLHHLKRCLKDDALRFIGSCGSHHESIENMWNYLDKKYNDLWMISNKMVKDFFNMQEPINEQFEIDLFWTHATEELRDILDHELNLENIFGLHIIHSLPMPFQLELVKQLQKNEQEEKRYGLDRLLDSYNNVMCVRKSLYITHDTTISTVSKKEQGHRKYHGGHRGRGKGRACKRYD